VEKIEQNEYFTTGRRAGVSIKTESTCGADASVLHVHSHHLGVVKVSHYAQ